MELCTSRIPSCVFQSILESKSGRRQQEKQCGLKIAVLHHVLSVVVISLEKILRSRGHPPAYIRGEKKAYKRASKQLSLLWRLCFLTVTPEFLVIDADISFSNDILQQTRVVLNKKIKPLKCVMRVRLMFSRHARGYLPHVKLLFMWSHITIASG